MSGQNVIDFPPFQRHSVTSFQAAVEIEANADTIRGELYRYLYDVGADGLTDQQMQSRLELDPSTQRPRRVELCRKGLVVDSGRVRETSSGRKATVWVARRN